MLENQFIQITSLALADAERRKPMPVCLEEYQTVYYKIFYDNSAGYLYTKIAAVNTDGDDILEENIDLTYNDQWLTLFVEDASYLGLLYTHVSVGETFFLRLTRVKNGNTSYLYSQPLVRVPDDGFVPIEYYCNEDAFGFPFKTVGDNLHTPTAAAVMLPIRLHSPQNVQDDKTYVKGNGEVVTLYAKYYKEWEGETEYLSEEMHDKIVAALSCDEVYIDGKRVTKTDKYQVDWENYDLDCDGVTKLAKATFKVRENITQRNSNY